jgi:hypothetical protein
MGLVKKINFNAEIAKLRNQNFFGLKQEKVGIIIPLYTYPSNVFNNFTYNFLIDLIRSNNDIDFIVILNPSNGPGDVVDGNYTKAIDRLKGAGAYILGYIYTSYRSRKLKNVINDVIKWKTFYPKIDGIFIDEVPNVNEGFVVEEGESFAFYDDRIYMYYKTLTDFIHSIGFQFSVLNPGAGLPKEWFDYETGDIYIIFENNYIPNENWLKGDYDGGFIDYLYKRRAVLLYGIDDNALLNYDISKILKYAGWFYSTNVSTNPWNNLGNIDLLVNLIRNYNLTEKRTTRFMYSSGSLNFYDKIIFLMNPSIQINLPTAFDARGINFLIKNLSLGTCTIYAAGGETINNSSSYILLSNETINIVSDGSTNWIIL